MIMTDSGFAAIEASSHGPLYRVMSWLGLTPQVEPSSFTDAISQAPYPPMSRVPQTTTQVASRDSAKLAESYAFHALVCARNGGYSEAESYFREAFTLDRKLAPTTLTNFWQLPRQAHEAVKRALLAVGRDDDALELTNEITERALIASQPELVRAAS